MSEKSTVSSGSSSIGESRLRAVVTGTGSSLPSRVLTNKELEKIFQLIKYY